MKRTLAAALFLAVIVAAGCEKDEPIGAPSLATSTPVAAVRTATTIVPIAAVRTAILTATPSATSTPSPIAAVATKGGVYYRNCTEGRTAGAAPVRIGQPGYGTHLDRDRDGIGCE
jgi:hypothetical protein